MTRAAAWQAGVAREVRRIALGDLDPVPWNARRGFDEAALAELAESIARHGVVVPLLVRERRAGDEGAAADGRSYEIVCGHRRHAAALRAGLREAPCQVRALSDEAAREVAMVDNLQREELPPMDEAEAYGKLLERPGATIETVAAALAKPPGYVSRRAQLLRAIAPARAALKAGAIEAGHLLELARLDEERQRHMLSWLECGANLSTPNDVKDEDKDETKDEPQWRPTCWTVAQLRRRIAETAFVELGTAPFPLDANLAPLPCTECPKRSGNAALLFGDCGRDTCTDRRCFGRKVEAWIAAELEAAAEEKRKLLRLTPNWTTDKTVVRCEKWGDGARVWLAPGECGHGEEGIWIEGREAGKRATVCRNRKCAAHFGTERAPGVAGSSAAKGAWARADGERKAQLARVKAEREYRAALFARLAKIDARTLAKTIVRRLATGLTRFAIQRSDAAHRGDLAAAMGLQAEDLCPQDDRKLRVHLGRLPMEQRLLWAALAIEASDLCVHEHEVTASGKRFKLGLEELAETVGVRWQSLLGPARAPASAGPEAPAPGKKGGRVKAAKRGAPKAMAKKAARKG